MAANQLNISALIPEYGSEETGWKVRIHRARTMVDVAGNCGADVVRVMGGSDETE